ncbi:MAG: tripartite tricarboxylate transporter TctB family protein [Lawsonibacter sp.]|jgi:putative tricarboxylic transport membrane protein
MERTRIQDLVIGLIVSGIGIFGVINALGMPDGTRPYTLVVTGIFTFLGLILTGRSIYFRKKPSHDCGVVTVKEMINPMIAFLMILAYTLLLDVVGFFVTSGVFMLVMMVWMGYRKIPQMVLTTAIMLGFIYVLFVYQLKVALPSGILF